ncbi:hypothetical protein PCASD_04507 [Puccinia coronata f. sp. avenae]|uniref:Uncharacterized protein n=1 Tax=Puccinia coronata f. sp. avenae TaxID=200324 RepID=A0A2N5V356_9BASI|nr:hypothetical protein PCASD_15114 [Puccinia coronata f. sp. avenae]PLW44425.1 hypothetical protein PCASD_04507 [Puccinia coronata f. sp. avenae]
MTQTNRPPKKPKLTQVPPLPQALVSLCGDISMETQRGFNVARPETVLAAAARRRSAKPRFGIQGAGIKPGDGRPRAGAKARPSGKMPLKSKLPYADLIVHRQLGTAGRPHETDEKTGGQVSEMGQSSPASGKKSRSHNNTESMKKMFSSIESSLVPPATGPVARAKRTAIEPDHQPSLKQPHPHLTKSTVPIPTLTRLNDAPRTLRLCAVLLLAFCLSVIAPHIGKCQRGAISAGTTVGDQCQNCGRSECRGCGGIID